MPTEHPTSQSQTRPALNSSHRSTSSVSKGAAADSPSTSPHQHGAKAKAKHVVHGARTHTRVPSTKGLHKLTKAHGNEGSHQDLKKLAKNSSTTSLKKNTSHVSLKKNRSATEIRPRSSHGLPAHPASVHFEIGDQEEGSGWESASQSPALSRNVSRSAVPTTKASAGNSRPPSPASSPPPKPQEASANGSDERTRSRHSANAITEKLLQRTHSINTTKMSLATATPQGRSPPSPEKSQISLANGTSKVTGNDEISRFVAGSGTPNDSPTFLRKPPATNSNSTTEDLKRAQSMGELSRPHHDSDSNSASESALAPRSRSRKSTHHISTYIPPQQSRTQQKLWLQRASSNMEPTQMGAPGIVGLSGLHGAPSLVGAGYDGRDPRIKSQLERTGLEYLVVRRHQDPIGKSLKRLSQLPGAAKGRRIASRPNGGANGGAGGQGGKGGRKENHQHTDSSAAKSSLGSGTGSGTGESHEETGLSGSTNIVQEEEGGAGGGVGALLRSMWEKTYEFSTSAD